MSDTPPQRLPEARRRADTARARFSEALRETRERVKPARLKQDLTDAVKGKVESAKDSTRVAVREHPVITTSVAASGVALMFWRPARFVALYGIRGVRLFWITRYLRVTRNDD